MSQIKHPGKLDTHTAYLKFYTTAVASVDNNQKPKARESFYFGTSLRK